MEFNVSPVALRSVLQEVTGGTCRCVFGSGVWCEVASGLSDAGVTIMWV